jgi:hypothetical protein
MRSSLFALAALLIALIGPATARAGGVGIVGTGGMFSSPVYYYDKSNNYAQFKQTQLLADYGSGIEFVLGDRDDRISGVFRGFWLQDAPQKDPAEHTDFVAPDNVVASVRDTPSNIGAATFGVQWGLLGDPNKYQLVIITAAGSGFLTTDRTEFLMLQGGVGGTIRFDHRVEVFADADYSTRFRKRWSQGFSTYAGVRYLFD